MNDQEDPLPQTPPPTPALAQKRKIWITIGLITTAVVLIVAGLVYTYWFQNPNKVMSDAVMYAINAKSVSYTGTVAVAGNTKLDVTLDGESGAEGSDMNAKFIFDTSGKKYTLEGSGVINEAGDLYFKVKNIDDLAANYRAVIPAESQLMFDKIIAKVDDQWIKVSSEDVKRYSEDIAQAQKCLSDTAKRLQDDTAARSEITAMYEKHPFIAIDKNLGSKDGNLGYSLKSDNDKEKRFAQEFKNTETYKALQKCDSRFTIKGDDILGQGNVNADNTDIEIWVHQWTHQIKEVVMRSDGASGKVTMSVKPIFNQPVTIVTPKNATTLEQLQKDIQALLQTTPVTTNNSSTD